MGELNKQIAWSCQLGSTSHFNINPTGSTPVGWSRFSDRAMNIQSPMQMQRKALLSALPPLHPVNPVLTSALHNRSVSTVFPTTLSVSEAEQRALYPGYYLRVANGQNFWFGRTLSVARGNFDRITCLMLSAECGWQYDIEYSHGQVLDGGSPWANLSAEERFI